MNILIADDERDIRNLLKINFEKNGFSVYVASNGLEAFNIIEKEEIDLIVLDVMMPVLDGFNFLHKIRDKNILIPVIFLTARDNEIDKILGLRLGADDFLSKPFSIEELIARAESLLRRTYNYSKPQNSNSNIIKYYDLTLDKETCCVFKKGKEIELGAKEYKLLLYFMQSCEKVFTKKQLYKAIWYDDLYYDDNTIMVHISRLRNKIETNPKSPQYLKTIRGIGYKLHYLGDA